MSLISLQDLADVVRASGLTVVELPGWRTRGRPGTFAPRGVLVHHTGGDSDSRAYVEWMALTGRPDLPAPLCQLALDREGTVYVLAAGRANHGGVARASGPLPAGDANAMYIGIEALNTGSEGWTETQFDAYVRLSAALCAGYGWPAERVRAHRETSTTGKWDPGLIDMPDFRAAVARTIPTVQEDAMSQYADQLTRIEATLDRIRVATFRRDQRLAKTLRALAAQSRRRDKALAAQLAAVAAELEQDEQGEA